MDRNCVLGLRRIDPNAVVAELDFGAIGCVAPSGLVFEILSKVVFLSFRRCNF
jgi:hypothetical protein